MPTLDPDWSDPCAVLAWLRPRYYALAAGGQTVLVRYGEREVRYAPGNPGDADKLAALIRQLEADCAVKQGARTGRRRAFTFG
jgi:gpW